MSNVECTPAQTEFLKSVISNFSPEKWKVELAGRAGSSRYFLRLSSENRSYVLVVWDGRDEDWPRFLNIQNDLCSIVPFLPKIYKDDVVRGLILEEDLGSTTLKSFCLQNTTDNAKIMEKYRSVLDALYIWQSIKIDASPVIASRSMDLETFLWESWYFAHYCITDYFAGEHLLNSSWEKERRVLAEEAAALPKVCIHRDFQSENVMLHDGKIRFVDYQGARLGPAGYDVASLLFDPYVTMLNQPMVTELFKYYNGLHSEGFDQRSFYICAAQRLMQALGAYGNLSIHKGKEWYRDYIPVAIERLWFVLSNLPEFPVIAQIVSDCRGNLNQ
jgi:aminoglycoside/choline kinase family phosphotransferase